MQPTTSGVPRRHVDHREAFVFAVENRPIDAAQLFAIGVDRDALIRSRFERQADVGDFGIGVGRPGHDQLAQPLLAERTEGEQGVLNADAGHRVGGVRELVAAGDVAGGKDPRIGRLQEVVDRDAPGVVLHAGRLEVQSFDIRRAAGGDENRVGFESRCAAGRLDDEALAGCRLLGPHQAARRTATVIPSRANCRRRSAAASGSSLGKSHGRAGRASPRCRSGERLGPVRSRSGRRR